MSTSYDAIIVGGGHNGLVCGAYLARAGKKVVVLERRDIVGGAAVTEELWPGYRLSTASYTMALLQPRVILDLELRKHGYAVLKPPPMFMPLEDGRSIVFHEDPQRMRAEIAQFSQKDAEAYFAYRQHMARLGAQVQRLLFEVPPTLPVRGLRDLLDLGRLAWRNRGLNERLYDLYDTMTLSAYDYLARWFESDEMRAALGFYASGGGANSGIRTPGSAYVLLRGFIRDNTTPAGGSGFVRGGMGAISDAISASGRSHGMEVRTGAPVASVTVSAGRATGVVLESGERIEGRTVVSNACTRTLFCKLLPAGAVPQDFLDEVSHIRDESTVFKLNLGLRSLPAFKGFDAARSGFAYPAQTRIGPSTDYIERAYDSSKYGEMARRPVMTIVTASAVDDTLAPPGKHVMSIMGQHAPYTLRGRHWDDARDELLRHAMDTLEAFAPGFAGHVEHTQLLAPPDFERIFDLPRGHVHHGELSADQIFFRRPVRGAGSYRTPIAGLYQCGASTHPGGGVTGVPGHNAAHVLLSGG
ncbi:phytoene desaturase family protein [Xenophilus aerolatus]|nr:NAD(P)/FAD-dependent oxidoreductase [Xenophilus aerolatus]